MIGDIEDPLRVDLIYKEPNLYRFSDVRMFRSACVDYIREKEKKKALKKREVSYSQVLHLLILSLSHQLSMLRLTGTISLSLNHIFDEAGESRHH